MNNTWWLPKEKQYLPETKRWYCSNCQRRTPLERNPEWNGEFKGEHPAPEWFVRCSYCHGNHMQSSFYACPNCGWDEAPNEDWIDDQKPEHLIEIGSAYEVMTMEYSGCREWEETWKCAKCKTVFTFSNGNY